jgi:hypothetical protein
MNFHLCGNLKFYCDFQSIILLWACELMLLFYALLGRAVAQAVSRWFPTAAVRVRVRAACGVCGGQSGTGAGFLRVLQFPLPIIIPPISSSS